MTAAETPPYTGPENAVYKVLIVDDEFEIRRSLALYYPWGEAGFVVAGQEETAATPASS